MIPANLHFNNPDRSHPALSSDKLFVVNERMRLDNKTLAGVSSFGVGGAMAHAILKYIPQQSRDDEKPSTDATKLFFCSSISEQSVETILQEVERMPEELELQSLIGQMAMESTTAHKFRGYCLLNTDNKISDVTVILQRLYF